MSFDIILCCQVELVRTQLRRATERYGGPLNSSILHRTLSQPLDKEISPFLSSSRSTGSLHLNNIGNIDYEVTPKIGLSDGNGSDSNPSEDDVMPNEASLGTSKVIFSKSASVKIDSVSCENMEENKKPDSTLIPDDFRCPISLELMKDPVIVATGQVQFA